MITRKALELDSIGLLAMAAIVGVVVGMYYNNKPTVRLFSLPGPENSRNQIVSPLSPAPKVETFTQVSPDGTKKLTMTVTSPNNANKAYSVTSFETANTSSQLIYEATLNNTESLSLPFNTWSPDNAYVFLDRTNASGSGALVFKANGQQFSTGQQFLDILSIFTAKNTGNTYKETTGWASETLLIVNTTKQDGSKGPSYWVEIPSKAVIQLSSEF